MSNSHTGNSPAGNHKALAQEVEQLWDRIEVVRTKLKGEVAYLQKNRKVAFTRAYQIFGILCAVLTIINCIRELFALLRGEQRKKDGTGAIILNTSLMIGKMAAEEVYRRYNESQSEAERVVSMSPEDN
jgi:hypothetical protein